MRSIGGFEFGKPPGGVFTIYTLWRYRREWGILRARDFWRVSLGPIAFEYEYAEGHVGHERLG